MNSDELREAIWEDLFKAKTARSINEIAALTACNVSDVRTAVDHEWFTVDNDRVSIAYVATGTHSK